MQAAKKEKYTEKTLDQCREEGTVKLCNREREREQEKKSKTKGRRGAWGNTKKQLVRKRDEKILESKSSKGHFN